MRPTPILLSAALLAAATPTLCALGGEAMTDEVRRTFKAEVGELAPDFELTDLDGESWTLSEHRGKTVVLEWYNPKCPVVKDAHNREGALHTLGNVADASEDVAWVAINSGAKGLQGAGRDANVAGKEAMGMEYPLLLDETGYVGRMYGATTTPQMFVIDAEGVLQYAGGHDDRAGTNLVDQALRAVREGRAPEPATSENYGCDVKYPKGVKLGYSVPDFRLADLDGEDRHLSDYRGKVLVLEWFNPNCPFVVKAHEEGGALEGLADEYAKRNVAWLAVNSAHEGHDTGAVELNRSKAEAWRMGYPILRDTDGKLGKAFGAKTTPHMYVIDERGVLLYAGGHDDKGETNYVRETLEAVLAGKDVPKAETEPYGCNVKYGG